MSNLETGPIYGVPLIQSLPLGVNGGMSQAMPSRADLSDVRQVSERVVAGYEVLLSHYRQKCCKIADLESEIQRLKASGIKYGAPSPMAVRVIDGSAE